MSPPREIELKFELPAHSIARLNRSSLFRGATVASRKPATLLSVYFDTDKLMLRNKGLSLRVRRIGRRYVQTIKQEGRRKRWVVCTQRMGVRHWRQATRPRRSA